MASTVKHLRSSTANKRPTASGLSDGQLGINTASGTPGVFFKDSAGTVTKVGPVHVGSTAPNVSPAGSAGNSRGELWVNNSTTINGLNYYTGSAFVNLTPSGTTTVAGLVELATDAETQTGTDTVRAVTPSGLQSKISNSTSTTSSTTIASSTAVKAAYDLADAALPKSGGRVTGALEIGPVGSLSFEGSSDDSFETTIAVVNPTADRTITFPNITGTVVTTGDTGTVTSTMIADGAIVNADINASAEIAVSKLADGAARQLLQTDAAGTGVEWTNNVDIPGTLDVTGATVLDGDLTIPDKIIHAGDTNTAIRFPAADTIAFETDGSERARIDSSGKLGLGTTSPGANLQIGDGSSATFGSTAPYAWVSARALSQSNNATTPQELLRLSWEEGSQDLGSGEGCAINFAASLIGDSGTFYPVASVASFKEETSDSTRTSALTFSTSADGTAAPVERARIDSSGRLLLGASLAATTVSISDVASIPSFQNAANNQAGSSVGLFNWSSATSAANLVFSKSKSGTIDTRGLVASGDDFGSVIFAGDDGTNFVSSAAINGQVDGTPGTSDMPGRLLFRTKAAGGTGTPTERMRITSTGALLVGTTSTPTGAGSGAVVAQDRLVISSTGAGRHQTLAGSTGTVTATTGTVVFKFKYTGGATHQACLAKLSISQRANSGTTTNSPHAEYAFQLFITSGGVCSLNGAATIFEYTYVRATHLAFADLGSNECTVTLTNPTGQALTGAYKVELLAHAGAWTLDSVTTT
jgi:hypothetical protein